MMNRILAALVAVMLASGAWAANELGGGAGTVYPAALDVDAFVESATTYARQAIPNDTNAAVVAIENELGVNPSGALHATVASRLASGLVASSGTPQVVIVNPASNVYHATMSITTDQLSIDAYAGTIFRDPISTASSATVNSLFSNAPVYVNSAYNGGALDLQYGYKYGGGILFGLYSYGEASGSSLGLQSWTAGGTANNILLASNGGKVGVGINTPGAALQVSGNVTSSSLTVNGDSLLLGRVMSNNSITGSSLTMSGASSLRGAVTIGAGDSIAGDLLEINKLTGNYTTLSLYSGTSRLYEFCYDGAWNGITNVGAIGRASANSFALATNNLPRLTATGAGLVGIGIVDPGDKLQVAGGITGSSLTVNGDAQLVNASSANVIVYSGNTCQAALQFRYPTSRTWVVRHSGESAYDFKIDEWGDNDHFYANRLTIDRGTGNVGIGTTTPYGLLSIQAGASWSRMAAGDATFTTSSSRKLKKDIVPVSAPLAAARIGKLTPVSYHWKTESSTAPLHYGLIAEDACKPYSDGASIDWQAVNAELIAAVNRQQAQIEDLQVDVLKLQGRVRKLEGK